MLGIHSKSFQFQKMKKGKCQHKKKTTLQKYSHRKKRKINYSKFQQVSFVVHTSRAKKNPVKGLAPTVTYWDMAGGLFFIAALYPPILEAVFI